MLFDGHEFLAEIDGEGMSLMELQCKIIMISIGAMSRRDFLGEECLAYLNCPVMSTECDAQDNAGQCHSDYPYPDNGKSMDESFLLFPFLDHGDDDDFCKSREFMRSVSEHCERDKSD